MSDNVESAHTELARVGEYNDLTLTDDGLRVELYATNVDDLAMLSETLYHVADDNNLTVSERAVNNPNPVGTDAHGNQTIPGLIYTLTERDD
jgi:hypothetical protein